VDATRLPQPNPDDHDHDERPHGCISGVVYIGELIFGEDGEEVEVIEGVICRRCEREEK
jgi:hypothetical protein